MKKLSRIFLMLSMTGILSINTFAFNFKDITQNHWAYQGASYMQEKGYMTVNSNSEFSPNQTVSYFDIADILARATGYVDENVVKDMDETFKASIQKNYEHQLPYIKVYSDKYTTWETRTNEEIAYILGRGYLKNTDLSKFMVKTTQGQQVKKVLTKEDLAVMLVRVLAKEETAKSEYTQTGFADEASIAVENRPHVAYLAKLGILTKDVAGKFNPNTPVTRGICAKMVSEVLSYKDKIAPSTTPTANTGNQTTASGQTSAGNIKKGTISKLIAKNDGKGSYFINIDLGNGSTSWASLTTETLIFDENTKPITVSAIKEGAKTTAYIENKNNTEHITKIYVASQVGTSSSEQQTQTSTDSERVIYAGTINRIKNGSLTIVTEEDKQLTYPLSASCLIRQDGEEKDEDSLEEDMAVKIYVQNNQIIRINILEEEAESKSEYKFDKLTTKVDSYVFTVSKGTSSKEIETDKAIDIIRNNKKSDVDEIRIGDEIVFVEQNGKITKIEVSTEKSVVEGRVTAILIGVNSQITIEGKDSGTYYVTSATKVYNENEREYVALKDVIVGAMVELELESKEVTFLDIVRKPENLSYKGMIREVASRGEEIVLLVEYDTLTKETMVEKTIKISSDTSVVLEGKEVNRRKLEEDMEVLVLYDYSDEIEAKSVLVLNR